jgi:hypothetical protein
MSFTSNIPAVGQSLGSSRTQVLNNFASLRTTISNGTLPNHIDVNNTGAGKHIFLQMPVQSPSAANLTLAGEFGVISKTANGNSELFFNRDGSNTTGTPNYYQLTAGTPVALQSTPQGNKGSSFLPGGVIVNYGQYTTGGDGVAITFLTPFPTACFGVVLTIISGSQPIVGVYVVSGGSSPTTTQFITGRTTGSTNAAIFWYAIGN